jgi:hypothetical protein
MSMDRSLRLAIAVVFAVLISSTASAQTPTGQWSGTYTLSIPVSSCQNKTFTSSGNVTATFLQSGTSLLGRIDLTNVVLPDSNCKTTTSEVTSSIMGMISGSSITWNFPNDQFATQFAGSIVGDSIVAQITDNSGGTGSLTMTRATGDPAAVDVTGSWTGTYSFTDRCSNGGTQTYTGAMTLGLTQSGVNAGGVMTMQNVPLYDQSCRKITSLTVQLGAAGTISGSTFNGAAFDPTGSFEFPVTATINATTMSGTVAGANTTSTTGTFSLMRANAAVPASDLSGTYEGSYTETDNVTSTCLNFGALRFTGSATLSLAQAGTEVAGVIVFHDAQDVSSDGFGNCFVVGVGDEILPLYGTLSGNTVTLTLPLGGGATDQFTVTFDGTTANGTIADSFGDSASFTATKSVSVVPPVINSFTSSRSSIVSGESVTLSWSTSNATSVSIDNGIGAQPVSGSVSVSPLETTIYTLTATDAAGSASAQTTITVSPPGPKRRAVRRL